VRAGQLQLEKHHVQVLRPTAIEPQLASRGGHRDRVRAGLEVIRDDGVLGAAQILDAINDEALGADAFDARTHLAEQMAQVLDVWLTRGVEDLGTALGKNRGQEDVLSAGDGWEVEHDALPAQAVDLGDYLGLRLLDLRAHLAQATKVLLESPRSDVVATRARNAGLAKASEERAEEHDRRTHPPPKVVGHMAVLRQPGLDDERAVALDPAAQPAEYLAHQRCVGHPWNVVEPHRFGGQEGGSHLGQRGVLRAAHADITCKLSTTCDAKHVVITRRGRSHRFLR